MTCLKFPNIQDAVAAIYDAAELKPPTTEQCIAPLDQLIRNCQLTRRELDGLTSQSAAAFLLRRGGLEPSAEASDERLAGFLYVSPNFGSIFVEREDPVARRRFSAAHELGHYLLHFRPLLAEIGSDGEPVLIEATDAIPYAESDLQPDELPQSKIAVSRTDDAATRLPAVDDMERQANEFAAELLMPETVVRELADKRAADYRGEDMVWRMATEMLVSQAAMRWRLRALGLFVNARTTVN